MSDLYSIQQRINEIEQAKMKAIADDARRIDAETAAQRKIAQTEAELASLYEVQRQARLAEAVKSAAHLRDQVEARRGKLIAAMVVLEVARMTDRPLTVEAQPIQVLWDEYVSDFNHYVSFIENALAIALPGAPVQLSDYQRFGAPPRLAGPAVIEWVSQAKTPIQKVVRQGLAMPLVKLVNPDGRYDAVRVTADRLSVIRRGELGSHGVSEAMRNGL